MVRASLSFDSAAPLIAQLRSQLDRPRARSAPPAWILVAHADDEVLACLRDRLGDDAVTVALPQDQWDFDRDPLRAFVEVAVRQLGAGGFALVAAAPGPTPAGAIAGLAPGASLLDRIWHQQARARAVEDHLVHEHAKLTALVGGLRDRTPRAAEHAPLAVGVEALLYRREAGVFCALDAAARRFRALVHEPRPSTELELNGM